VNFNYKMPIYYADILDMNLKSVVLFVLCAAALFIPYSVEAQSTDVFRQEGIASWYGREFDGRPTASGEIYDSSQLTAAHLTLPFGTMVVVTNRHNNKRVTVRINDRGPFVSARVIDVSRAAAEQLDMIITGTAPVLVESVDQIVVSSSALTPPPASPPVSPPPAAPPKSDCTPVNPPAVPAAPDVNVQQQAVPQTPVVPQAPVPQSPPPPPPPPPPVRYPPARLANETTIAPNKVYRLQVGAYEHARNAVEAFERLKNAGLSPNYEQCTDSVKGALYRVVIAGVRGSDVQSVLERLGAAAFTEALIREEH
jgi:rare lipoprotein A